MSMQDETLKVIAAAMKLNAAGGKHNVEVTVTASSVCVIHHDERQQVKKITSIYGFEGNAVERLRGVRHNLEQMELEALQAMQPITEKAS